MGIYGWIYNILIDRVCTHTNMFLLTYIHETCLYFASHTQRDPGKLENMGREKKTKTLVAFGSFHGVFFAKAKAQMYEERWAWFVL